MAIPYIYKPSKPGRPGSIQIVIDGQVIPISDTAVNFTRIFEALKNGAWTAVRKLVKLRSTIAKITDGKVECFDDGIYFEGKLLHNALTDRMMEIIRIGSDVKPLSLFLENLMKNPSESARNELYGFLQACDLPITDDGHFYAYKVIRADYTDCHTGKMDNSIGTTVKMKRADCDSNRNETCSTGLHFCSRSYIPVISNSTTRLVQVKVNPEHVVSIPTDYNNAKGRACEYLIHSELETGAEITPNYSPDDTTVKNVNDYGISLNPTNSDNIETAKVKVKNSSTKLDVAKVKEIYRKAEAGFTYAVIAADYGVHRRSIERIVKGDAWAEVYNEYYFK